MPYINPNLRHLFVPYIKSLSDSIDTEGQLTYCLYTLLKSYIEKHGCNYDMLCKCMGSIENTKHEFYRRVIAPYEDKKIEENGDV